MCLKKHGLGIKSVEQQRRDLSIRLKGKEIEHTGGFVYVCGMVTKNRYLEVGCGVVSDVMEAGNYKK